jgi:phosphotransferase system HPr-like phosphotransfer protein
MPRGTLLRETAASAVKLTMPSFIVHRRPSALVRQDSQSFSSRRVTFCCLLLLVRETLILQTKSAVSTLLVCTDHGIHIRTAAHIASFGHPSSRSHDTTTSCIGGTAPQQSFLFVLRS